ncbi:MAG: hypothetical protein K2Q14_08555 [Gammaproteobacteria bacterium]|nr:hypothetical protein [Gammaproteobacteria bacterium]
MAIERDPVLNNKTNRSTLSLEEEQLLSGLNKDANAQQASKKPKRNRLVDVVSLFEGILEPFYIIGTITFFISAFLGLSVIGSPLLIAACIITLVPLLGLSIWEKFHTENKQYKSLEKAIENEKKGIASMQSLITKRTAAELDKGNDNELIDAMQLLSQISGYNKSIVKIVKFKNNESTPQNIPPPKKSFGEKLATGFNKLFMGMNIFKSAFTLKNVAATTFFLTLTASVGIVLGPVVGLAAAAIVGGSLVTTFLIRSSHAKKIANEVKKIEELTKKIEIKSAEWTGELKQHENSTATENTADAPTAQLENKEESKQENSDANDVSTKTRSQPESDISTGNNYYSYFSQAELKPSPAPDKTNKPEQDHKTGSNPG